MRMNKSIKKFWTWLILIRLYYRHPDTLILFGIVQLPQNHKPKLVAFSLPFVNLANE